jgi:DNA-directed RNA polymerase specialized sigma24 family protein
MVELRFFFGCTVDETAEILGISTRTVEPSLRLSLAWLRRCLA